MPGKQPGPSAVRFIPPAAAVAVPAAAVAVALVPAPVASVAVALPVAAATLPVAVAAVWQQAAAGCNIASSTVIVAIQRTAPACQIVIVSQFMCQESTRYV